MFRYRVYAYCNIAHSNHMALCISTGITNFLDACVRFRRIKFRVSVVVRNRVIRVRISRIDFTDPLNT